jgi:hypothetical protein
MEFHPFWLSEVPAPALFLMIKGNSSLTLPGYSLYPLGDPPSGSAGMSCDSFPGPSLRNLAMVAHIRPPEKSSSPALARARRLVAAVFLSPRQGPALEVVAVPAWKAWLFTAWVVGAVGICLARLVGF